jgi:hypothetical protein
MMNDHHINIFYSEDDVGYIADIPDLETCSVFGETPEDALREVQKAKASGCRRPVPKADPFHRPSTGRLFVRPLPLAVDRLDLKIS